MRFLLRGVFIGLAMLVLATQAGRLAADMPADEASGFDAGMATLGLRQTTPMLPGTLAAAAPGCAEPLALARVDFNGLGRDAARALLDLPAAPRFVYLGLVGAEASPASVAARWVAASVLHAVGLRPNAAPRDLVLVMLPSSCPALARMDWSRLSPWI